MTSSGSSGGAFRPFERPRVIRRVGALLGRGKAHVRQCAAEFGWLNLAAHEAVYDRQVPRILCRIPLADPLAGSGAEGLRAAVVREHVRRRTDSRATHGVLARIAHDEKGLWISEGNVPLTNILGDGMPIGSKPPVPAGILRFQPLALRCTHARIGVPPNGRSPVPDTKVQGMVKLVQLLHEEVPIPRTLQAEVTDLINELLNDPFEHELFE